MLKSKIKPIAITLGDPFGIGPEVVSKALNHPSLPKTSQFLLIGDKEIFNKYFKENYARFSFIDLNQIPQNKITIGKPSRLSAQASLNYLLTAVKLIKQNSVSSLVTAPISKEALSEILPDFQGHTEFLAEHFNVDNVEMMFVQNEIKTVIATRHISLKEVVKTINTKDIFETICLTHDALRKYFKIKNPTIALCGLNPHAGEGGAFGNEETDIIIPAIKKARQKKINALGPLSGDTIFVPYIRENFDAIIAMYHDQGLAPIKAISFNELVNLTIGLPFIRTSPAHGTAFNIAGKNKANETSMLNAIKLAIHLSSIQ